MANITLKDIIRAIDTIICREDLFTDEAIAIAFDNRNNYVSKAAQSETETKTVMDTFHRNVESLKIVNAQSIGRELNVSPDLVRMILKSNGITDFRALAKERQIKIMRIVADLCDELESKQIDTTKRNLKNEFIRRTGVDISENSVTRALVYHNKKTLYSKQDPAVQAVKWWIYGHGHGGITQYLANKLKGKKITKNNAQKIFQEVAMNVILEYGELKGYVTVPPMEEEMIMRMLRDSYDTAIAAAENFMKDIKPKQNVVKTPARQPQLNQQPITQEQPQTAVAKSKNWYKIAKEYNKLPGGRGEGKHPSDFPKDQVEKGIEIEYEHGPDKDQATEIALDHLSEFSNYYTGLDEMEKKLKKEKK